MMSYATLTQALIAHQADNKSITHIKGEHEEKRIPLRNLYERALGILHHLQAGGLTPGSELILLVSNSEQFIDVFWACLFGKIIPVPLAMGVSDEHRQKVFRIFKKLQNPYVYADTKTLARLSVSANAAQSMDEFVALRKRTVLLDRINDISQAGKVYEPEPQDIAFIQFSSGSTSEPKGIVLTHHNLVTNINGIIHNCAMSRSDICLNWMPLTHDMGLIAFHLSAVVCNASQHILSTESFIRRPSLWLLKASEKQATILYSPNFGYRHFLKAFDPLNTQKVDLSPVRLILNGAEPISATLCEEFTSRLMPYGLARHAMLPCYGLAEASVAVSFSKPEEELKALNVKQDTLGLLSKVEFVKNGGGHSVSVVNVGRPVLGCRVRIADDRDNELPEHVIGFIQIKGDNVMQGYYHDEPGTQAVFTADGWLDTGDLGFSSGGELYITGRQKDIIFVNGQNYYPHDLERLLEEIDGIELGKVVVCGVTNPSTATDDVLVFLLFRGSNSDFAGLARQARKHLNEQLGIEVAQVVPVKKIPKTTSGKIQRYLLGKNYLSGEYNQVLAELDSCVGGAVQADADLPTEIGKTLQGICDSVVIGKRMGLHDNIFEFGTSSLTLTQIYEGIEGVYPGKLDITDFFDYPTLADLAIYLEGKIKQSVSV